uniref:C-type lectin domain-containing protein n=1 Tax=Meloidogyne hapla TaxID=6305 RepID=A0A1I8BD20_MELHA
MKLSVSKIHLLSFLSLQYVHFVFVNAVCPTGWNSRSDSGIEYGYQVVMQKNITYDQAQKICSGIDSDIVSIHSREENEFVYGLIGTSGVNLFIGMQQKLKQSPVCSWPDQSPCDFGNFQGLNDPRRQQYPWVRNPSISTDGNPVECVGITDTSYAAGKPNFKWNDISCNDGLDGVICKKRCSGGNKGSSASTLQTPANIVTDLPVNTEAQGSTTKSGNGGGNSPATSQSPSTAPKASTGPQVNTGAPAISAKPGNDGGNSPATSKPPSSAPKASTGPQVNTVAPVISAKPGNGGGNSPTTSQSPSTAPKASTGPQVNTVAPVISAKPGNGGGSSRVPIVTVQPPKTFATLMPGLPGVSDKPVNGGGNNGSCGTCNCNDDNNYKCGSDDWQFKLGKDGKSFAYKYFTAPNISYFDAKAICAKYHALPSSINSEEENSFLLESVAIKELKSKKRAKREIQEAHIWTGIHIVSKEDEDTKCYCDDGNECSYGHKNEDEKDDDDKKKEKKEEKNKKKEEEDKKKKEEKDKKNEKKEEEDKKKKEEKDKKKEKKEEEDKKKKEEKDKKKENKDKKKNEENDKKEEKDKKKDKDDKKKEKKDNSKDKSDEKKDKSTDKSDEKKGKSEEKECSCKGKSKTKKPKATTPSPTGPSDPWAPGCPSKPGGGDKKHCVAIGNDGKWIDVNCEHPGTGIICKRPCSP